MTGSHVSCTNKKGPRLANLLDHLDLDAMENLPQYGELAVFGLNLSLSTHEDLVFEGFKFLHNIRKKWHSLTFPDQIFDDLVRQWD